MRYYRILIVGAPAAFPLTPDGYTWESHVGDWHDPEAQQIEFTIEETNPLVPSSNSVLTVKGVSWDQIKQSGDLVGKMIYIHGGMKPGFDLATIQARPPLPGLLMEGVIFRCWGNWIGTEMSIGMSFAPAGIVPGSGDSNAQTNAPTGSTSTDAPAAGLTSVQAFTRRLNRTGYRSIDQNRFLRATLPNVSQNDVGGISMDFSSILGSVVSAGGMSGIFFGGGQKSPLQGPLNIIHNMMPNVPLSSAMTETLQRAFPQANINMLISPMLKLPYQDAGVYQSLEQYMKYINPLSKGIATGGAAGDNASKDGSTGNANYSGVQLTSYSKTLTVFDWSVPVGDGQILFYDLIGQPTWIDIATISIKTVLRSDIHVGMKVTLPPTIMGVTQGSSVGGAGSPQKSHISFEGEFLVTKVLYLGDYRNPDGAGWSANYEATTKASTVDPETSAPYSEPTEVYPPPSETPQTS